ncbi:MAG: DUF58 domain-containing protein [Nitrospina sp.]|jgi:uncharacterized protein (DUF58 family)|nr:DUF58 domain-containing protein [Nitrospina sp.]MBT3413927.1 DUF58 domain-containing protein [Nitrospina sp.]MBT3857163.1 DUF58 domain-containing protein [Nitrospina sp.]MBT4105152.1 DUF58 domain-containing protein [Nitrospina sp.]MBT4389198.1 DUF58 domain-containing protein [Nitrospina sp.]
MTAPRSVFTISLQNRTLQLTREGFGFIVILFGVGLGAINTGNNLLYLILAMCCSFIAVSGVLSEMSLKKLRVQGEGPAYLYAQEPGSLKVKLSNHKKWAPSYSIRVKAAESHPSFFLEPEPYFFFTPAGETIEKQVLLTAQKRGHLKINACRLATRFPFGFFYKTKTIPLELEMVIFPAIRPVELPQQSEIGLEGEGIVQPRGDELHAIREFQPGDSLSCVYWKSSAKTGNLRVKEFQSQGLQSYTVFLTLTDPATNRPVAKEVLEERVSTAASMIYHLIQRGHEVSLKTEESQTPFDSSQAHLLDLMRSLAFIGLEDET